MALLGFLSKDKKEDLNKGLEKTKESVFMKLSRAAVGKSKAILKGVYLRRYDPKP